MTFNMENRLYGPWYGNGTGILLLNVGLPEAALVTTVCRTSK